MKKFDPKPGDTIVTNNGEKYICVSKEEYPYLTDYPDSVIYAVKDVNDPETNHMNWDNHDGLTDDDGGYSISRIIPRASSKAHKHADLIKQWADNKNLKIQVRRSDGKWTPCWPHDPMWKEEFEYRIKPEPKPDIVREVNCVHAIGNISQVGISIYNPYNLKLTFDGETGKLKAAEVI